MAAQKISKYYRGTAQTVGATTATVDIPIPTDTAVYYRAVTLGHEVTSGNEDSSLFVIYGLANNNSGTVTDIGYVADTPIRSASIAASTVGVSVSTTNIRLTYTGVAAITINWQYEIKVLIN